MFIKLTVKDHNEFLNEVSYRKIMFNVHLIKSYGDRWIAINGGRDLDIVEESMDEITALIKDATK